MFIHKLNSIKNIYDDDDDNDGGNDDDDDDFIRFLD